MSLWPRKMPDKNQDVLPTGWKGKEDSKKTKDALETSYKWTHRKGTVLPHFLTVKRIETMNKANAILPPFKPDYKPDGKCVTVQCSTGCYYAVVVPLIKEWLGMVGLAAKAG